MSAAAADKNLSESRTPSVLVMNLHYTGVGIARNLRDQGIRVYGLSSEGDAPGMRSRLFQAVYRVPHSRDAPEALCEELIALRRAHDDAPVIFPTCDSDVLFLAHHAQRLAPHFRLPEGLAALANLMDKLTLASLALRERIATPRTLSCSSQTDVDAAAQELRFPVVMKPRSAHEWRKRGVWHAVGARKAIRVDTSAELNLEYSALPGSAAEVLLQEYVPGSDHDIVVCCCYMEADGTMLGYFTGRKLRQSPPLFGTGCMVEAVEVPGIVDLSRRLLKACGYAGIAEIEFKRDPSTGQCMLIEVNPRHWDQHALGMLVGVNLSLIAYQRALGQRVLPVTPHYPGHGAPRWIAERELFMAVAREAAIEQFSRTPRRLVAIGRAAAATVFEMARLVRRPITFPVLNLRDPVPGAILIFRTLREAMLLARRGVPASDE